MLKDQITKKEKMIPITNAEIIRRVINIAEKQNITIYKPSKISDIIKGNPIKHIPLDFNFSNITEELNNAI